MKILVTGGSGRIGRYVVCELVQAGHQVTSVDLVREWHPDYRAVQANLTDAGQVYQVLAMAQAEAVVHLGAWSRPAGTPSVVYGDNVLSTFNVFQACADLGVRRVIFASSNHVYGMIEEPPLYVPVDEAHPLRPADSYALSKVTGEGMADYFTSRWDIEILSFRFMGVRAPSRLGPEIEREAQDPGRRRYFFWTRTDARDAALACRLALEAAEVPSGPYNITGRNVVLEEDSAVLVRRYYGDRVEIRAGLTGRSSPLSCAKAERAFGYRPQYDWSVSRRFPEEPSS